MARMNISFQNLTMHIVTFVTSIDAEAANPGRLAFSGCCAPPPFDTLLLEAEDQPLYTPDHDPGDVCRDDRPRRDAHICSGSEFLDHPHGDHPGG